MGGKIVQIILTYLLDKLWGSILSPLINKVLVLFKLKKESNKINTEVAVIDELIKKAKQEIAETGRVSPETEQALRDAGRILNDNAP